MKKCYPTCRPKPTGRPLMSWLMVLCVMLAANLSALAQDNTERYSFNYQGTSLMDVLRDVNRKTGNKVVFRVEEVEKENSPVTVNLNNVSLVQAVRAIVAGKNFRVESRDGSVVLVPQAGSQQPGTSRQILVHGKVVNQLGAPMAGVTVVLRGTQAGSVTDGAGNFSQTVTIPEGTTGVLQFSFIGMQTVEVPVTAETINVVMRESATDIGTVVVTGIVDKPKESYTGAVTSITRRELQQFGNRSVVSTIQNIDPSFLISEDLSIGSDPNRLPDISIRGSSSLNANIRDIQDDNTNMAREANLPLFIKDGFEISLRQMLDLDQNIVENITILKDASATAMYGTRGANGVVVITTRRPEEGTLLVTYSGSINIEAPDLSSYNLMDAGEKLAFEKAAGLYNYSRPDDDMQLQELYNLRRADVLRGVNTYWLKYPVRTGVGSKHSLRMEGGSGEIRYSANISYDNVAGAMKGSARNTLNGDMLLMYKYKNVSFQNNLAVAFNKSKNSPYGKFGDYGKVNSYFKPYDDNGTLYKKLESGNNYYHSLPTDNFQFTQYNPLWDAYLPSLDDSRYMQVQNNFEVVWDILPDLNFRGRFGITKQTSRSDEYTSAEASKYDTWVEDQYERRGEYVYGSGESMKYEMSVSLNYNKVFRDKHQVFAAVYANFAHDESELYKFKAQGISNPDMDYLGMAALYPKSERVQASEGISRRLGATANVNYTYDGRFFADVTGQIEGSSRFGADNRTAPFWSVGAGWNMHQEEFLRATKAVNTTRIRLSYGTSGSQNFNPYQALLTFRDYGNVTYEGWYGSHLMAMGNRELGWQTTYTLNAGFDLGLFNDRIYITADFFDKKSKNVLADVSIPSATGFNSYASNIGELQNRGFDINLRAYIIRGNDWRWTAGVALRYNKNKILKISNALEELNENLMEGDGLNPSFLFKEGQSLKTIFVVKSLGIDPSNGKEIFVDKDGEITYKWDARDKVACGVAEPKYWGNFNTSISYKKLTLTAVFSYRYGADQYNSTLKDKVENIMPYENADKRAYYDRWKNPGDDALYKSVRDFSDTNATSRFVMKDNSLRCTNISLQYELRNDWLENNLGISYMSVTAYTEDVFYIGTVKQERGLDYPFARKFSLSLRLRF